MSKKIWVRNNIKNIAPPGGHTKKADKFECLKATYLLLALATLGGSVWLPKQMTAQATSCPDLRIVFARGSGAERNTNGDFVEFRGQIDAKLSDTGLSYEFIDLDYPAVSVGIDNLAVAVGALISGGEAFSFGESVQAGTREMVRVVNDATCPETKYVLGGYSQGAMVLSRALREILADKVIYAATFGDPKLYLPEGAGLLPAACAGENLSDYRMYVPDCYAYKGLLGAYIPYESEGFADKLGTWCNRRDIFCSSHLSMSDHTSYARANLYEDASRVIASKVTTAFGVKNQYTSPHDTAILIDSTGSMMWLINQFKDEATRLANETFAAGGRVALYDYRDLRDPYQPVARCDFETCTAENFTDYLNSIVANGGGDEPESMLSAAVTVMNELQWQHGATKSLVVLTDAPYLSPDVDATTVDDVVALSKAIDPVNIYIITEKWVADRHPEMSTLAEATGGLVTTELGELSLLTDLIMERYDTLPRVEETIESREVPELVITNFSDDGSEISVEFEGSATGAIVILNEAVLGMVDGHSVIVGDLDRSAASTLVFIPINESFKGEAVIVELPVVEMVADDSMAEMEDAALVVKEKIGASGGGSETGLKETQDIASAAADEVNVDDAAREADTKLIRKEARENEIRLKNDVVTSTESAEITMGQAPGESTNNTLESSLGESTGTALKSSPEGITMITQITNDGFGGEIVIPKAPDTGVVK